MNNYKRTKEDAFYYVSDLNKYLSSLSKEMTVINLDTLQYKASSKILRIIESKKPNERIPDSQRKALTILSQMANSWNATDQLDKIYVYIVIAQDPFTEAKIIRLNDNKEKAYNQQEFKNWLEFKTTP